MYSFVTPTILASIIIFSLILFGIYFYFRRLANRITIKQNSFAVMRVAGKDIKWTLKDLPKNIPLPFTFEIVVNPFGKEVYHYIVAPFSRARKIARILKAKDDEDFELYTTGSTLIGAYVKGGAKLEDIDIKKIKFSKVNEIGESAVVQFVFNKKEDGGISANIRVLISAPSPYQAKEILSEIKSIFAGFRIVEVKNRDFLHSIDFRSFNENEKIILKT